MLCGQIMKISLPDINLLSQFTGKTVISTKTKEQKDTKGRILCHGIQKHATCHTGLGSKRLADTVVGAIDQLQLLHIYVYLHVYIYIYIKKAGAKWTWHVVLKVRQLDSPMSCEIRHWPLVEMRGPTESYAIRAAQVVWCQETFPWMDGSNFSGNS